MRQGEKEILTFFIKMAEDLLPLVGKNIKDIESNDLVNKYQ